MKRPIQKICAVIASVSLVLGSCTGSGDGGEGEGEGAGLAGDDGEEPSIDDLVQQRRETPIQLSPSTEVGTIGGRAWVDARGASRYSMPIDVAPGAAGFAPSVTLEYSSAAGPGFVGEGFSISGLPEVVRCPRTLAEDGRYDPVRFDASDALCYEGQRLVLESGSPGQTGSTYRLRSDPSKRFTYSFYSDCTPGNPCGNVFELQTETGETLSFAETAQPGGVPGYRWLLIQRRDPFGNRIDYAWATFEHTDALGLTSTEWVIDSIAYAGTGTDASRRHVRFTTQGRPDEREGFYFESSPVQFGGNDYSRGKWHSTRRLSQIRVEGPYGELLSSYDLAYAQHTLNGKSVLASVQKCDAAGACLPETTFAWQWEADSTDPVLDDADATFEPLVESYPNHHTAPLLRESNMLKVGDFDGDGRHEVLSYIPGEPVPWRVHRPDDGSEIWDNDAYVTADENILPGGWGAIAATIADGATTVDDLHRIQQAPGVMGMTFTEDASTDLLIPMTPSQFDDDDRDGWGVSYIDTLRVALPISDWDETQSSVLDFDEVDYFQTERVWSVFPLDMNADGRTDLAMCQGDGFLTSTWHYAVSTGGDGTDPADWDFYDTDIGCSIHDEVEILHLHGQQFLGVIPRYQTDPALMEFASEFTPGSAAYFTANPPIPEAGRATTYRKLWFDPESPLSPYLEATGLPRDLFQRWHDLRCNNSFVGASPEGAPLLGVGTSHDIYADVDGDGNVDILRFELQVGDDNEDLAAIRYEMTDDGQWHDYASCDFGVANPAVIRVYRNTGDDYVRMSTPFHNFFGNAHANFWLNFKGAFVTDWNGDGRTDLALPSSGENGDWTLLVSNGDGSATAVPFTAGAGVPDPWPSYSNPMTIAAEFDEFENTRSLSFRATRSLGPFEPPNDDQLFHHEFILLRAQGSFSPGPNYAAVYTPANGPDSKVALESVTDGLGLSSAFEYTQNYDGLHLVSYLTMNTPADCGGDWCGNDRRGYEYSDPVWGRDGAGIVGFRWVRETRLGGASFQNRWYDLSYDDVVNAYPHAGQPVEVEDVWVSDFGTQEERWHITCQEVTDWVVEAQAVGGDFIWQSYAGTRRAHTRVAEEGEYNEYSPGHNAGPNTGQCANIPAFEKESETTIVESRDLFGNTTWIDTTIEGGPEVEHTTTTFGSFVYDVPSWFVRAPQSASTTSCMGTDCATRTSWTSYSVPTQSVIYVIRDPGGPGQRTLEFDYDSFGNIDSIEHSAAGEYDRTSTFTYDSEGVTLTQSTNPKDHPSQYVFDAASGVPVALTDANGLTREFSYDGFYRTVGARTLDAPGGTSDGADVSIVYASSPDPDWSMLIETHQWGQQHTVSYDIAGRPVRRTWHKMGDITNFGTHPSTIASVTGPTVCTFTRYDAIGRVRGTTLPTEASCSAGPDPQYEREYTYDRAHRLISEDWHEPGAAPSETAEYSDTVGIRSTSTPLGQVEGFEATFTDADGRSTTVLTDPAGRVVASEDADGTLTCFDYGPFGRVDAVHRDCVYGGAALATTFGYDTIGRLASQDDPSSGLTTIDVYTGYDEVEWVTDAEEQTTGFLYDPLGRRIRRYSHEGTAYWYYDVYWKGAPYYAKSEEGALQRWYFDEFGHVDQLRFAVPGDSWRIFDLSYDQGRLSTISYPSMDGSDSLTVAYGYDGDGYGRAVYGSRTGVETEPYRLLWGIEEANEASQPELELFNGPDPHQRQTAYHAHTLRVDEIEVLPNFQREAYEWTFAGDLSERDDNANGQVETYAYDALHRLQSVTRGAAVEEFEYDLLGNLTSKAGTTHQVDPATGRLQWFGSPTNTLTYDDNGQVIDFNGQAITWNSQGLPESIETSGGTYSYDYYPDGSRATKIGGTYTNTTRHFGELGEFLIGYIGASKRVSYYVRSPTGEVVAEMRQAYLAFQGGWQGSEYRFPHADHLGSGSVLMSEEATMVKEVAYDAWGEPRDFDDWDATVSESYISDLPVGYTGHEAELDGGFIYMRGRMYSPEVGRFLSPDPIVENPIDAQTWNAYSYVLNNPLRHTDPTGLAAPQPGDPTVPEPPPDAGSGSGGSSVMLGPYGNVRPVRGGRTLRPLEVHPGLTGPRHQTFSANGSGSAGYRPPVDVNGTSMGGIDHGPRHKTPDPPPVYVHHTTVAGGTSDTTCANVNPGTTMGAACAATTGLDHMRALDDPAGADKAAQAQRESDVKKIGEAAAYLTAAIVAAGVVGPLVRPAGAATAQALSDAKALLVWAAGSVSYHLDRCTNAASGGCGTVAKSPLWKSVKRFGHTFSKHGAGAKNARALADRARSTGKPQGQWLDNQAASNLLKEITAEGPLSLRIPEGLGQVIRADGTTVPATWARVVPSADGIRTAFPILVE